MSKRCIECGEIMESVPYGGVLSSAVVYSCDNRECIRYGLLGTAHLKDGVDYKKYNGNYWKMLSDLIDEVKELKKDVNPKEAQQEKGQQ